MKKLISILLVAMLVIGMFPAIVSAEAVTETITFDANKTQRVSQNSTSQVWKSEHITFTNNKGSSSTNVADYTNPVRLYGKSELVIECDTGKMTSIVFASNGGSDYKASLNSSLTAAGVSFTNSGNNYTVTFADGVESFTFQNTSTKQIRLYSITVTYEASASTEPECEHANTTTTTVDATCTEAGSITVTCDDCGEVVENEVISATNHANQTLKTEAVAGDCQTPGTAAVYTCDDCGETLGGESTGLGDHNYVNGACTVCGESEPAARFEFGDNGSASHYDGSAATEYSETAGNYTLTLTDCVKMYSGAYDAMGNSCIKLGTGSAIGGFSFTVPNDIGSVTIYVAAYKANTGVMITVNGVSYTLTTMSNDGLYDAIEVDTSTTKTVTLSTTSSPDERAMVNAIEFVPGAEGSCEHTPEEQADGKAATCTETGLTNSFVCSKCGETTTAQEEIPMIAHNYENGACTACGKEEPAAIFEMGADGEAGHKDTTAAQETYAEEDGDYTLTLTSEDKMYVDCWDEMGNGGIKLGTGSFTGSFSFEVPAEVASVTIYVAGYKDKSGEITVNGSTYALTAKSNDGEYDAIEVDTAATKTVTLATTETGDPRAMVNTIEFYTVDLIEDAQGNGYPTVKEALRSQATVLKAIDESVEMPFEVTVDGTTYIGLADANEEYYTYYELTLKMSSISLRASEAGIYYGAKVVCDAALAQAVDSYGIVLSTNDMPAELEATDNAFTVISGPIDTTKTINSGSVFNIFDESLEDSVNTSRGTVAIYAAVYLEIDGQVVISKQEISWSLKKVVETINDAVATDKLELEGAQLEAIVDFYQKWAVENEVINGWSVSKLEELHAQNGNV